MGAQVKFESIGVNSDASGIFHSGGATTKVEGRFTGYESTTASGLFRRTGRRQPDPNARQFRLQFRLQFRTWWQKAATSVIQRIRKVSGSSPKLEKLERGG